MYLYCDRGNWYLYQQQKDKNDKWFKRTVATFGKTKPVFQIPFIYRGSAEDLVGDIKNKTVDLILTDPPYGLTQNQWDVLPNWEENAKEYERVLKDNGLIATFGTYVEATGIVTVTAAPGIPGFEILSLIAALGVAFILLRRRRN